MPTALVTMLALSLCVVWCWIPSAAHRNTSSKQSHGGMYYVYHKSVRTLVPDVSRLEAATGFKNLTLWTHASWIGPMCNLIGVHMLFYNFILTQVPKFVTKYGRPISMVLWFSESLKEGLSVGVFNYAFRKSEDHWNWIATQVMAVQICINYFPVQLYSLLSFVAPNLFPLTKMEHFLTSFSDLKGGRYSY